MTNRVISPYYRDSFGYARKMERHATRKTAEFQGVECSVARDVAIWNDDEESPGSRVD